MTTPLKIGEDVTLYCADCLDVLPTLEAGSVDLTVTSPPYDNLRTYDGYNLDFESIARELYRVTKPGGVVVWVVGDSSDDRGETLTSFKQASYFRELGFYTETMIWEKGALPGEFPNRYEQIFEFMFVFQKGRAKTFNPIMIPCLNPGHGNAGGKRTKHGWRGQKRVFTGINKRASNIWYYPTGRNVTTKDPMEHPAMFPDDLARDHIITWSNPGDVVLDPMMGSGTTGKMAVKLGRRFTGMECSAKYFDIAARRIEQAVRQLPLFGWERAGGLT